MGRIRLQICVLPWEQLGPSPSSSAQTRQETLKWCEPCVEETPMQEVCDKILMKWKRMFEASMGPLRIRHLKTAYGDFVDLEEQVVGDLFDDRGADGNIRNSILEVHRYPPTPDELHTLQRFSSLAPNSSARPRKRPLELPSQSYPSRNSQNIHREIPSIEESDAETNGLIGTATKRPRTHESRLNRTFNAHQPLSLREEQRVGLYHSSQNSGTQESIHQVLDSQKSPGKKHLNPYGTPTSLSLIGPQESFPINEIDLSAIPDSPLGRETMRLDREQTKSESPELGASVHEVPLTDPILASGEQHSISTKSPEPSTIPFIFNSASQPVSIQHIVEEYVKKHGLSSIKQTGEKAVDIDRTPKRKSSTADPVRAQNVRSNSRPLRNSDPIFDPIESDTESFHEKQKMQSAKRLRSTRTTSPRALNKIRADPSNGQFLVPSIPQSRTNRARISSTQVISPGQGEKIPKSRREPKDGIMGDQKDPKRHRKHDAESPEHAESESCEDGRINIDQETSNKNTVNNDLADAAQTSSQATTAWSQDSNNSVNGTGGLAVQRSSTPVTSQEQEPDEITRLGHDANGVFCNSGDNRVAQEAGRLAKEAEEQQEKKKIREKKAEEKEAVEKENAARKKGAEREANERRLADQKDAKEKQARAEQFAQAKRANAREEELAEAKRIEEKVVNAARLAEEQKVSESLARERQTRETTLVEEAKKMLLASDGAKQIEAEKKEKENSRRKELAAKKQADEAKAEKQAREEQGKNSGKKAREEQLARGKAQRSANIESKDAKQRTHQAGTSQETETTLKEHVRKLRDSEVQNRASTTPSVPLDVAGPKRSMTPVIPGSSVTKSSSYQNSVRSSPQSNRSSGSMNAPLRSALRQTPSALRRSGSSVSFDVLPRSILKKYTPSTPNLKSLEDMDNEPATKSSSATHLPKTSSKTVSNAPLKTPTKILVPKKAPDGKITKTPAKNGKVQTKLNVTREVKKLKGRAVNPPVTSTLAPKQEIVLSSGEDSSTSEEPKWQTGNAKAGPSSKKPTFSATSSQGKKTAQVKSLDAPIDPVIRNIKVERDRTAAPATLPRSTSTSDAASLQRSASRSPALALSETHSFSSGSVSSLASGSDSEMESDSGNIQAPSSKTPTGTKNGKLAPVTMEGPSKTVNVGVKKPEGYFENKASSQSNQASSSRSRSTASIHDHGKHVDQAADQQLQLESRQSLPSSRIKQAASSTTSDTAGNKLINQGLDHAGRLPNGTRPAYYQFPCLSELQKIPRAVTPVAKPKPDTSSSHALGALPAEYSGSDGSSSSSDDSSSDSNENEDVDKLTSQTSFRKKSGRFPGMRGVMKLANAVRSKIVPTQQ